MPILADRMLFVSPNSAHRQIKLLALQFYNIESRGEMLNASEAKRYNEGVLSYGITMSMHLNELAYTFRYQFSTENYRRTSDAKIDIIDDFRAIARAKEDSKQDIIEVSVGLMYGLEDLWQCVISDNNTDLHAYCGVIPDYPNPVLRDVRNFHALDEYRFYDYSYVDKLCYAARGTEENITHIGKLHSYLISKMISFDEKRINFGDFLADISFLWIMGHEDAHIYFGHANYFKCKLGISADELEHPDAAFLDLHKKMLQQDDSEPQSYLRIIAELQADELACTRLVDYLFDDELFELYPPLKKGVVYLINEFSGSKYPINELEARFTVIMRIAISSAISSIFLFYRNIEKKEIQTINYPQVNIRISSIITTTIHRAYCRLSIDESKDHQSFEFPSKTALATLAVGVSKDIKVLKWNLLRHPELLKDPDLPASKELVFSDYEEMLSEKSNVYKFVFDSVFYSYELSNGGDIQKVSYWVATSDTLYGLLTYQSKYFDKSNQYFRSRQLAKRPEMKNKYDDTYTRMNNQSEDIKKILYIADIIREDIGK